MFANWYAELNLFSSATFPPMSDWDGAKKGKNKRIVVPSPKNPARAGWLKRLGLVRVIPLADFAVIGVQLCSTMTRLFPYVALSHQN